MCYLFHFPNSNPFRVSALLDEPPFRRLKQQQHSWTTFPAPPHSWTTSPAPPHSSRRLPPFRRTRTRTSTQHRTKTTPPPPFPFASTQPRTKTTPPPPFPFANDGPRDDPFLVFTVSRHPRPPEIGEDPFSYVMSHRGGSSSRSENSIGVVCCYHNLPAVTNRAGTESNSGRRFYGCKFWMVKEVGRIFIFQLCMFESCDHTLC
ncbi:unnamed protein product [Linum trigynum]|uniref:Zinc finger GRF-type domain-containing protein n=1 Tax=Linum trigynum TaxID=586398 RepID=A0AAV2D774_9ROSI